MTKTVYLHIGHFKTGTTALQNMFVENKGPLRKCGVRYAKSFCNDKKHSNLAFSILKHAGVRNLLHGYAKPTSPHDIWSELFKEARTCKVDSFLISTEELMRIGAHPKAAALLREIIDPVRTEFEFRIIAYMRAPNDHLRSWYNQLVKMNTGPTPEFETAVRDVMEPVHYDYAAALAPWIDIFGQDAVIVRPYHEGLRAQGALAADFLSVLGIDDTKKFTFSPEDHNPKLGDDAVEVTRIMQMAGASRDDIERALRRIDRIRTANNHDSGPEFERIILQARAGLSVLKDLPNCTVDVAEFLKQLPQDRSAKGTSEIEALSEVLMFLVADMQILRTNLHERQADLLKRIVALEAGQR